MSDLKSANFSFRCDQELAEKIRKHSEKLMSEPSLFIRRCLTDICNLIDHPEDNSLPETVVMLRAANKHKASPETFKKSHERKTA